MTTEMAMPQQEDRGLTQRLTPAQVKADYDLVLQVMGSCMNKDEDYGVIPGTGKKATLYKPGAEKLMLMFRLAGRPTIEDLSGPDERRYRVTTEIVHAPTGTILGYGVGEASTNEAKWKWRKACKAEFEETAEDRRRKKHGEDDKGKAYFTYQVRTEPADLANTVLKMADKRSIISGVLKVTAASSVFNQDLEEMDKDVREAVLHADEGTLPPIKEPQRKSDTAKAGSQAPQEAPPNAQAADSTGGSPKKAPESFRAMESKIDGGSCTTCGAKLDKGEPIWFDTKARRAHCRAHFV